MSTQQQDRDQDRLRDLLRRGDPAAGEGELGEEERTAMRAEIVDAARQAERSPQRTPDGRGWRPTAVAAAGLLLLALGIALWVAGPATGPRPRVEPQVEAGVEARAEPDAEPGARAARGETPPRQVQFTTPGGTRIVWVLYPADGPNSEPGRPGGRDTGGTT